MNALSGLTFQVTFPFSVRLLSYNASSVASNSSTRLNFYVGTGNVDLAIGIKGTSAWAISQLMRADAKHCRHHGSRSSSPDRHLPPPTRRVDSRAQKSRCSINFSAKIGHADFIIQLFVIDGQPEKRSPGTISSGHPLTHHCQSS